jgi:hypothetical protein
VREVGKNVGKWDLAGEGIWRNIYPNFQPSLNRQEFNSSIILLKNRAGSTTSHYILNPIICGHSVAQWKASFTPGDRSQCHSSTTIYPAHHCYIAPYVFRNCILPPNCRHFTWSFFEDQHWEGQSPEWPLSQSVSHQLNRYLNWMAYMQITSLMAWTDELISCLKADSKNRHILKISPQVYSIKGTYNLNKTSSLPVF